VPNPFVEEIAGKLGEATGMPPEELTGLIETPPDPEMGDYALPCFAMAKTLRKAPNQIAAELAEKMVPEGRLTEVRATGPYLNFFVSKEALAEETLKEVLAKGVDYGKSEVGSGRTIVIDFSHPNIAKPFGIHHLRSTVIGNAIRNIYRALGYEVVGVNHLGDWGSQFAKLILAWTRWGEGELTEEITIQELLDLYVRIHEEIEDNPEAEKEAAAWFRRLEAGDAEARRMWQVCCNVSYKEFDRVYKRLGIEFESVAGESFYLDKLEDTLAGIEKKGLLKKSEGATIVDLSEWDMSPMILRRSDGATLYHTRDMAAIEYRWATYGFEKMLYVVDVAQTLHFRQLFKVLELMEYDWVERCEHVVFGRLRFKDGGMSTRRGKVIFLEDVLDRAEALAQQIIDDKNPDLPNKEDVVRDVGIGAVIFADLDSRRAKDVVFDWDEILNFNGETGPYVQYTHARYCSVLRKYGKSVPPADVDLSLLSEPETVAVVKCLGQFPGRIQGAADANEPSLIATYLIDLCTAANRFYNAHKVVSDDEALTDVRIALVYAITVVLANGMGMLGMKAPQEM
jgi:arginyl-tRNA synthetase